MRGSTTNGERKRRRHGPGRVGIGVNVAVQSVLLAAIVLLLNRWSFHNYRRWDVSRERQESLSSQTRNCLRKLRQPVRLIVFFQRGHPVYPDVDNLVKEYQHAGERRVTVEYVDPFRNYGRATELQKKYKFGGQESIVIVEAGDRFKFVSAADMADMDRSGETFDRPARMLAFKGEQALTAALVEVVEGRRRTLRVVEGHGQARPGPGTEYSRLDDYLRRQNLKIEPLDLATAPSVPEGTDALLVVGARIDLEPREIELLERYWEHSGRLLIFLPWGGGTPRLEGFLAGLGIRSNGDRILSTLDMGLGKGVVGLMRDVIGRAVGDHPVVARMKDTNLSFRGATQSFSLDPQIARARGVRLQPLIAAHAPYWGERDHAVVEAGAPPRFEEGRDNKPPLLFAVAAERGTAEDGRLAVVNSSRLIAVGNASCLGNDGLTEGAIDLAVNSINWLLDRKELIGIAPKAPRSFPPDLGERQMRDLLGFVLLIAAAPLGFGLLMWWIRSH